MILCLSHNATFKRSGALEALIAAAEKHGIRITRASPQFLDKRQLPAVTAVWGWRARTRNLVKHSDVLVFELGYIGSRSQHISLGWNGLNGHAEHAEYPDDGGVRFREHGGYVKPWKEGGDYILILGQVVRDASLIGFPGESWYAEIAKRARERYGKPVYFRPHPNVIKRGGYAKVDGLKNLDGTLDEALEGALFTIAYNSNSCLDSIMSGVPCYAGNKGTMAWDLCSHDINEIVRPDREKRLHQIAWTQWTREEIAEGTPVINMLRMKGYA